MTQKALSVKAFKELANKPENQPPAPTWESAGDEAKWDLDRCDLILQNVFSEWFLKVNSLTKSSTYNLLLHIEILS